MKLLYDCHMYNLKAEDKIEMKYEPTSENLLRYGEIFTDDEFSDEHYPCKDTYGDNPNFQPAYIKGVKGVNQIITTENVGELYQKLLCAKWDSDKVKPKWTNRDKPEFYNHEVGHND